MRGRGALLRSLALALDNFMGRLQLIIPRIDRITEKKKLTMLSMEQLGH